MLWIFFVCYITHGVIKHFIEANTEADVKLHYCVLMLSIISYPVANCIYVICISWKKGLKNRLTTSGCKSSTISLIYILLFRMYCNHLYSSIFCISWCLHYHCNVSRFSAENTLVYFSVLWNYCISSAWYKVYCEVTAHEDLDLFCSKLHHIYLVVHCTSL